MSREPTRTTACSSRGARALGWIEASALRRNVKGCADSGYCGLGCPVDGKQAMGITYIPDALAAGAELYANVRVAAARPRRRPDRGRTRGQCDVAEGSRPPTGSSVVIRPNVSPCSRRGGPQWTGAAPAQRGSTSGGRVGRRTFLHPVIATFAEVRGRRSARSGARRRASVSHAFIDRGPDKASATSSRHRRIQPLLAAVGQASVGSPSSTSAGWRSSPTGERPARPVRRRTGWTATREAPSPCPRRGSPSSTTRSGRWLQEAFRAALRDPDPKVQLAGGGDQGRTRATATSSRSSGPRPASGVPRSPSPYGALEHPIFTCPTRWAAAPWAGTPGEACRRPGAPLRGRAEPVRGRRQRPADRPRGQPERDDLWPRPSCPSIRR